MKELPTPSRRILVFLTAILVVALPVFLALLKTQPWQTAFAATTTPSGTPVSVAAADVILYDNAVASEFVDGSFGFTSRNPCDTALYTSPPCSYAIAYAPFGALNLQVAHGTLNTTAYTALRYELNPNGQPVSSFGVILVDTSGQIISQTVLKSSYALSLANGWLQISVPLSILNPSDRPVAAIQLKSQVGTALPTVHYDDITLTGGTGTVGAFSTPRPTATPPPIRVTKATLPGQKVWRGGVSSFLFGSNDTEEWATDNVQTDPHGIIQSSMKAAHFTLERTFIFHYSIRDGHRNSIGNRPQIWLNPRRPHEYDRPKPPHDITTGPGYEVETRVKTIENIGAHCLGVLPDIWTTPKHNVDPNPFHHRIIDPATGKPETDLDFARKVVAYLGHRCNLYEIGNEPDLDTFTDLGQVHHMDIKTYVERWTEFVTALRKINPKAKFIGPVTYSADGNDCRYTSGTPFKTSQPGDCYMQNFLHGVKGTKVEPNAISFHWYPCSDATVENCTSTQWNTYAPVINKVRAWIRHDLGHVVPIGITEWNFDPGANTALASNASFMDQYTRSALASMMSAGLAFACQFDTQSFSGYGALDMFDMKNGDQPRAQFHAVKDIIAKYRPAHAR